MYSAKLCPMILLLTALTASAEFLRIEVTFQGTNCISCTESLQGRLERVRGIESVSLDLDRSVVTIQLEDANTVRLAPLLSRITQDGTKISRTEVVVNGTLTRVAKQYRFQPAGLRETYHLVFAAGDPNLEVKENSVYEIRGTASGAEPGGEPVIEMISISPARTQ